MFKEIELFNWQKEVIYGEQRSLAVPAPVRSGKNLSTIMAASKRNTLIIVPAPIFVKQLRKECTDYGIKKLRIATIKQLINDDISVGADIEQVIFNEIFSPVNLTHILKLRDDFDGRIVVIGTPTDIPDPIFYPLSKIPEWFLMEVKEATSELKEYMDTANSFLPRSIFMRNIEAVYC